MGRTARRRLSIMGVLLVVPVIITFVTYSSRARAQQDTAPRAVHTLPVDDKGAAEKVTDMGATYHYLEGKAARVSTRFKDGSAVAERGSDGDFRVRLRDVAGNELSQLAIDHESIQATKLEFAASGERIMTNVRSDIRPTLGWANTQAHALWRDRPDGGDDVQWRGRLVRSRHPRSGAGDDEPTEVEAEFDSDVKVTSARNAKEIELKPGLRRRPTFISHVVVHDLQVGEIRWYAKEQVLAWDYPGLTKGFVNAERLREKQGWPFEPTLEWATVQGLAFYDFHSRIKKGGTTARSTPGLFDRILNAMVPTVSADVGCDYLHWLDTTIFRPCCDTHDRCYERNTGCTARSWLWAWGDQWTCSVCNSAVTLCFLTGGVFEIDVQVW